MRITANKSQSDALSRLRGLPEAAHFLVMSGRDTAGGTILEGREEAFAELVSFISEELADGMLSAPAARSLASVCIAIDPECADWLGM